MGLAGWLAVCLVSITSVSDEVYKLASINLSPNVPGQIIMGLMCNPPKPGDESYAQFMQEKDELLQSLK